MKRKTLFIILLFVLSLSLIYSDEGMFLPNKLSKDIFLKMKKLGLKLSLEDLYSTSGSLSQAVIMIDGGTGSFVSKNGLILTNHHVAFVAAQRQSSLKQNIIQNGFLAKKLEDEIPAPGYKAYILKDIKDVTKEVLRGVSRRLKPEKRYKRIERNIKKLIKREEGKSRDYECQVKSFYGGLKYYLFKYLVLRDIRIVYIPSRSIGEYGGEIDNWMWPRHTGDFSFLRAYVGKDGKPADYSKDNVPYHPERYLKFSAKDIDSGDFALVMGFPGRTRRYITAEETSYYMNFLYPESIRLFKKWISIMEEDSKKSKEAEIKNAGMIKGLSNAYKNYMGTLEGMKRINLLELKKKEEKAFIDFINSKPELERKYGHIIPQYFALIKKSVHFSKKSRMLSLFSYSSKLLSFALTLNKWSIEKMKKDMEREPGYMKRDIPNLKLRLQIAQRSLYLPTDKKVFKFFIMEALKLPDDRRIETVDKYFKGKSSDEIDKIIESMYKKSKLADLKYRMKLFDYSRKKLLKENDPFIEFAISLQKEIDRVKKESEVISGKLILVSPKYMEAMIKFKGSLVYPDANRTLRINFGTVKGYSPKDAVYYLPQTTLKGVIEKETGKWPFIVPEALKKAYLNKDYGSYIDPELNDVPVDFLTTNDSTGGNSGSPLINGNGELMGLLFDGNYESIVSDYYFLPEITRTISVDSRYILFVADKVDHAKNVLQEIEIVK